MKLQQLLDGDIEMKQLILVKSNLHWKQLERFFFHCLAFCYVFNQFAENRADVLQKAEVKVWTNEDCQTSFSLQKKAQKIQPTQMCAGRKIGGIDACWV